VPDEYRRKLPSYLLAWASDGVLFYSSSVIASRRDAGRSTCSSGLAWASDGVLFCSGAACFFAAARWLRAGWPEKLLPRRAGLMSPDDRCRSRLRIDSLLRCCLDASVVVTDVTDPSLSLESESHCDWRSISLSVLVSSPVRGSWPDIDSCLKVAVLSYMGPLLWREVGSVICQS
jgi:hypothetical protein